MLAQTLFTATIVSQHDLTGGVFAEDQWLFDKQKNWISSKYFHFVTRNHIVKRSSDFVQIGEQGTRKEDLLWWF